MLKILSLSIILSIDALSFGFSFGLNKIRLPLKSAAVITLTGLIIILGSIYMGDIMYALLPQAKIIGGLILIGMGIFLAADCKNKNTIKSMLNEPKTTDINCNGKIETGEAMAIGIALSIDSSAVVIGTAYLGLMLPAAIMLMQLLFMIIGLNLGKKIKPDINSRYIAVISGIIIIVMGFHQLI
ncbi:MAG: manganese efflux pump [Clostridia bacterium]|nr:manganese efflux pump [Clostridia bacterium]